MKPLARHTRRHLAASPFNTPTSVEPVESFAVDDRVAHDKYGLGRVVAVEAETSVVVDFGSAQVRVGSPFTSLTKL
jgi:hypothetical protein